jgi:hypothetical protein
MLPARPLLLARDIGQVRDVLRSSGADSSLLHVFRTLDEAVAVGKAPRGTAIAPHEPSDQHADDEEPGQRGT